MYLIALIPLVVFGFYKNGIDLFQKGLVGFGGCLRPLLILLAGVGGALIGGIARERRKGIKIDRSMADKLKGDIVEAVLIVAILPIASNPIIIFVSTFVFSFFLPKLSLNKVALMYLIIEGTNVLLGLNKFANVYEMNTALNYDGYDLFFGSGTGGIFSTNIFLITMALIFLSFCKLYKRETVYSSLVTFLILAIVPAMVMGNYKEIIPYIFGYNILFILVFIAPNLYSSSYTVKGQIVSGVLIGILTFALSFVTPYTAAIIAVLIASLLKGILDRMFVIK